MTPAEMRSIALSFPGAEEGFSQQSVAFKVNGKILAPLIDEVEVMIVGVGFDEREILCEAAPATYYFTPH
jgi:hypothetical protein